MSPSIHTVILRGRYPSGIVKCHSSRSRCVPIRCHIKAVAGPLPVGKWKSMHTKWDHPSPEVGRANPPTTREPPHPGHV